VQFANGGVRVLNQCLNVGGQGRGGDVRAQRMPTSGWTGEEGASISQIIKHRKGFLGQQVKFLFIVNKMRKTREVQNNYERKREWGTKKKEGRTEQRSGKRKSATLVRSSPVEVKQRVRFYAAD
jgi:hypothetical protein